jgi:hypothetical protein
MDSLKKIINLVFFVDIEDSTRKRRVVDARRAYAKILKDAGFSYQHIGHTLNKDHSTIIHYVKSVDGLLKYDSVFEKKFILAKKNFLKENKHLMLNSKEDIYAIAISLENQLDKAKKVISEIIDYLDNHEGECVDYCRKAMMSLFEE